MLVGKVHLPVKDALAGKQEPGRIAEGSRVDLAIHLPRLLHLVSASACRA